MSTGTRSTSQPIGRALWSACDGLVPDPRRALLVVIVFGALTVAVGDFFIAFPDALDSVRSSTRTQQAKTASDKGLAPAFNYDISRAFEVKAEELLPQDARYVFVTGPHASASMPITVWAAPFVSRYLLLPRRSTGLDGAQWLLCYGCSTAAITVPFHVVWREPDAAGLLIARLH